MAWSDINNISCLWFQSKEMLPEYYLWAWKVLNLVCLDPYTLSPWKHIKASLFVPCCVSYKTKRLTILLHWYLLKVSFNHFMQIISRQLDLNIVLLNNNNNKISSVNFLKYIILNVIHFLFWSLKLLTYLLRRD